MKYGEKDQKFGSERRQNTSVEDSTNSEVEMSRDTTPNVDELADGRGRRREGLSSSSLPPLNTRTLAPSPSPLFSSRRGGGGEGGEVGVNVVWMGVEREEGGSNKKLRCYYY